MQILVIKFKGNEMIRQGNHAVSANNLSTQVCHIILNVYLLKLDIIFCRIYLEMLFIYNGIFQSTSSKNKNKNHSIVIDPCG
jgi:hypothetical protein